MAGGRPSGGSQDWDPGPPWRFFLLFIMVALSRVAQRPLDPLVSSSFFATNSMLLSGGPHMFGGGGHHILGTSSCAASSLSLCDYLGLGFATPEISPFVCGSAPYTPEDGRPTPQCGSRVLYAIRGGGHSILGTSSCAESSLSLCDCLGLGIATPEMFPFVCGSAPHVFSASAAVSTHPYGSLGLCKMYPNVITHYGAIPELGLCEDMDGTPRGCWNLPGHDDSATSSAFSLGLPQHCGISSRCGSDRHLSSASAAVSTHPYGSLGLCKMYHKVITHSGAIPELGLCEDTNSWPKGCWHLPGHVLDWGMGFLMGR